ncbi:MAG: peptidase T [Bacteroidetes bacterium]|nr:MAG: peptidase T [Bacteroidota bacterium]
MKNLVDRFLKYVSFHTTSKMEVEEIPSTPNQHIIAKYLGEELKSIGMKEVDVDEHAYVMATLPANIDKKVPVIGFVAHHDTSPDFTGENVNPQIQKNYNGETIVLNEELNIVLSPDEFPSLLNHIGDDLITTDGTTLLGADDKAGIAEIVTAMEYLIEHPEIEHGKIRVCFTPDEEIGKGADLFDVEKFGAEWAYTMDGSETGELEYENFNAAFAKVKVQGKIVHPGYAKNVMRNAMTFAADFALSLPQKEVPEHTEGYEGFYHQISVSGGVDEVTMMYIIRDHDMKLFEERKKVFQQKIDAMNQKYGADTFILEMSDQYYNMREKVEPVKHVIDIAKQAMIDSGITPDIKAIRGGTDGARLSFMGLPCPNIFAGGINFHGRYEYVPIQTMEKATQVIVNIARITAEQESN